MVQCKKILLRTTTVSLFINMVITLFLLLFAPFNQHLQYLLVEQPLEDPGDNRHQISREANNDKLCLRSCSFSQTEQKTPSWVNMRWKSSFFPGLLFHVYIESPNPWKTEKPHTTGPKPHHMKIPNPKTQSKTQLQNPNHPKPPKMNKMRKRV